MFTYLLMALVALVLGAFLAALPKLLFGGGNLARRPGWRGLLGELGGYVHDTHMAQYIPPTLFHFATATITWIAGQVTGTIVAHRAAAAQTSIITIPITIPSNASAQKGAYLVSVEIDYENVTAAIGTSLTPVVNLVTRGADTAVATVAAQTFTQSPSLADSLTCDQHKLVLTLTTPIWILNTQYVLVQLTLIGTANTGTNDFLGAVANFTLRI